MLMTIFPIPGTVRFIPAAWAESPFDFELVLRQQCKDADGSTFGVDHTVKVSLRRDNKAMWNMIYFNLIKSEERVQWIKVWRVIFKEIHEYGIVDNPHAEGRPILSGVMSDPAPMREE